jgi:phosphoribosylaminoimidazole-succinocarboxamide synthase
MKIVVFISGNGTNLQALIDAQKERIIPIEIVHVISNQPQAFGLKRCEEAGIPYTVFPRIISGNSKITRKEYDEMLLRKLNSTIKKDSYNLIVLAGWMHILSDSFLKGLSCPIINLHPALPNAFPGGHAVEDAFHAFQQGNVKHTGIMVHHVVPIVDAGNVIAQMDIPIYDGDELTHLKERIKYFEKGLLLKAIEKLASMKESPESPDQAIESPEQVVESPDSVVEKTSFGNPVRIYSGKVRDVYDIGYGLLAMHATDRQSAFDRHICAIPGKGVVLNQSSAFWMTLTEHIVPNHLVFCKQGASRTMICKKAKRFDVEVIVRGYITGSTSTSLWTHYNKGERVYCGVSFPDGLQKNQKLDAPVITPTTKGVVDEPISAIGIVGQGLMTYEEWTYVSEKALELFNFGAKYASKRGLILVDTKYEFGTDSEGNIMLIDEIHTCDSSRYWMRDSYEERFSKGENPESLDKDVVRRFIAGKCDPYKEPIPEISDELISRARDAYFKFYSMLREASPDTNERSSCECSSDMNGKGLTKKCSDIAACVEQYFSSCHSERAIIFAGSTSDQAWIDKIRLELEKLGIYSCFHISSAHKTPLDVLNLLEVYSKRNNPQSKIIFITVAGMSNALGGMLSANTDYPVINCPPITDKATLQMDIWSSIRNPSNVPAMLVLSPLNVAVACKRIFTL